MSDVFLSYASEDRARVAVVARALETTGWTVFWDRTIPVGLTWRDVIGREIKECHAVVVCWSEISVTKEWVQEEAEEAKRRRILFPVLIDNVLPPFGFGSIQAADLTGWTGDTQAPAFVGLVKDLSRALGAPPGAAGAAKRIPPAAARAGWDEKQARKPAEPVEPQKARTPPERPIEAPSGAQAPPMRAAAPGVPLRPGLPETVLPAVWKTALMWAVGTFLARLIAWQIQHLG